MSARPDVLPPAEEDRDRIARGRPVRRFGEGERLHDRGDASERIHLLLSGSASVSVVTPFGCWPALTVLSPSFLNLGRAFLGSPDPCVFAPAPKSEGALIGRSEARALLFDLSKDGAAFRRLALRSVTAQLRGADETLRGFFDAPPPDDVEPPPAAPEASPLQTSSSIDIPALPGPGELPPWAFPHLGLSPRRLGPEERLLTAGEPGEVAYLLAEGELRVSILIPGVGEEAVAFLAPGEVAGEMALVDDGPRSADVTAHDGPALVYAVSRSVFRTLLASGGAEGATLLARIAVTLCRRLHQTLERVAVFRQLAGPF